MPDGTAKVQIDVGKPGGVDEAAAGFYQLAKAAKEATNEVKAAQSAGGAFMDSVRRQNREGRKADREQRAAAAAIKAQADYEASRKQKAADDKKAETESKLRTQRTTNMISAAGSGGATGVLGAMGGKAGTIGAMIQATGQVMDRASKGMEILSDSYQTNAQKMRGLISEFVPLGDKLIRFGDAIDGTADKINRQREKMEITKAQDEASFSYRGKMSSARLEQTGYQAQYAAHKRYGIGGYLAHDRSTLAGERAGQRQDATIGSQDDLTRAVRESAAAKAVSRAAQNQVAEANRRVAEQRARVSAAEDAMGKNNKLEKGGSRDKAGRDKAAREVENERARLSRELATRESAVAAAKEKGLAAIQAEGQARAASVNLAKAELAVLEQQEQRMRSQAQSVGAMSQGERLSAVNALKAYQDNGGEAPPEIEALVARIAPDLVRKNQENRGAAFLEGDVKNALGDKGFADALGGDFGKGNTLKEVMGKVDAAKADIRVTIDLDTAGTAKQLAELLKPTLENLTASFTIEIQNIEKRIKAGNVIRNNATN